TDPQGRFIICDIKTNEKCFTLGNIYAPNEDNPTFFLDFFDHLADFKCDDIIIGGDYNLTSGGFYTQTLVDLPGDNVIQKYTVGSIFF
ncbi:unnamed protein product, partial [Porites evermanni]